MQLQQGLAANEMGLTAQVAQQQFWAADVSQGHSRPVPPDRTEVRFTPDSDRYADILDGRLRASGHAGLFDHPVRAQQQHL
jgi:hypothetical protein